MRATVKLRLSRNQHLGSEEFEDFKKLIGTVAGRLSYLTKVAKSPDMLGHAQHLLQVEKAWLTSQIGLIPDHDDDVMDEVCSRAAIGQNQ